MPELKAVQRFRSNHQFSEALCFTMKSESSASIAYTADVLVELHGAKARQKVVDEIVTAIKNHDLDTARLWDQVGQAVDARLAA